MWSSTDKLGGWSLLRRRGDGGHSESSPAAHAESKTSAHLILPPPARASRSTISAQMDPTVDQPATTNTAAAAPSAPTATSTPAFPLPPPKYDVSQIPKALRIRAICDWELTFRRNTGFHADVFRYVGASYTSGWELLRADPAKHDEKSNNEAPTLEPELRGRKRKISPDDVHEVEELLREHESWARDMNWDQLAAEVFIDRPVIGKTLQRHLGVMDFFRCISCARTWCTSELAKERLDFARAALEKRPQAADWEVVAFTDKVHVGWGPTGKPLVTRRPGERLCKDCFKLEGEPEDIDDRRVHGWATYHHDWKSEFYPYSSYHNGNMTVKAYTDEILEPYVKPWLDAVAVGTLKPFILEEEKDSAFGLGVNSPIRKWKRERGLETYFGARASPDLAPFEDGWRPLKYPVKRCPRWDGALATELVADGWSQTHQEFVQHRIHSMPDRLRRCIEMDGQPASYVAF